jgi:hypothetical protein
MDLWAERKDRVRHSFGATTKNGSRGGRVDVRGISRQKGKAGKIVDETQRAAGGTSMLTSIMLADAPARSASEPALWFDYGKDY